MSDTIDLVRLAERGIGVVCDELPPLACDNDNRVQLHSNSPAPLDPNKAPQEPYSETMMRVL